MTMPSRTRTMTVTDTDMTITVLWSPVVLAVEHTVADETSSFTLSFRAVMDNLRCVTVSVAALL